MKILIPEAKETSQVKSTLIYLLVLALVSIPIFGFLDALPIQIWDESRNALNALSMYYSGDWLITKFGDQADLWNTKPPLLIWLQVIFMKLIGPGELAVRLPSAIAAFLTCFSLLRFFHKQFNQIWIGAFASLVLVTSYGYMVVHGARTGDYDVLLSLFVLNAIFWAYRYSQIPSAKSFFIFCLFISLGVYTKGIAAFLVLPGVAIFWAYKKLIPSLLKSSYFYLGIIALISFISLFYVSRELAQSGYLQAVYENELGGRFIEGSEGHQHGFWFYFDELFLHQFQHWLFVLPLGIVTCLFAFERRFKDLGVFILITSSTYLLSISLAATKIDWYLVAIIPVLSILVGLFIGLIFDLLKKALVKMSMPLKYFVLSGFFFLSFHGPFQEILFFTNKPKMNDHDNEFYSLSLYLKRTLKNEVELDGYSIYYDDYSPQVLFYYEMLRAEGTDIHLASCDTIKIGNKVIIRKDKIADCIYPQFDFTEEDIDDFSSIVTINFEK